MELSLPAGNLQCAVTAFENGADSVYFGLKSFSARAGAGNFSEDDYRRIRRYALDRNRKIYIALNTVVDDCELRDVFRYLSLISLVGCDGLLVQDFGIVRLVKKFFPSIPLHASTQMAVQNADGVKALKALGFTRVVLARELSLDEIESIRRECPDIELKVFVHGALCYGVSGLCYASRFIMGGRSANRGSCAQVCRMKFASSNGAESTPFSLCDLVSDASVMDRLKEIGIDSVKIEGRLKGPEYVKWATRYYRALIDKAPAGEVEECKSRLFSSFSRKVSYGFLKGDGADISLSGYQGHRGAEVGRFVAKGVARLSADVRPHDGLMYIDGRGEAVKFANSLGFVKRGMPYAVKGAFADAYPVLYRIKDSRDNPAGFDSGSLELWRMPLDLRVSLFRDRMTVSCRLVSKDYEIQVSEAKREQDLAGNFRNVFSRKGKWCSFGEMSVENGSGLADAATFVPLSALKAIAVDFNAVADAAIESSVSDDASSASDVGRASGESAGVAAKLSSCGFGVAWETGREFKVPADVALSPVVFGRKAPGAEFFSGRTVELNNVSQLLPFLSGSGVPCDASVVVGPYFNVTNMEAVSFFSELFGDFLKGVWSSPEGNPGERLASVTMDGALRRDGIPMFVHRNPDGTFTVASIREAPARVTFAKP